MNPWCHRQVIYIVRCVYSSSFKICKHIFFREMNSLVTPKIFFFRRLTNSFFGLTFGATDKCFISSASSTCQVIFCLYGSSHPQLVQFLYHQWSRVLLQRGSVHQSEGETAACIFSMFFAGTSCRCSAGSHCGVDDGNMFLIRKW